MEIDYAAIIQKANDRKETLQKIEKHLQGACDKACATTLSGPVLSAPSLLFYPI